MRHLPPLPPSYEWFRYYDGEEIFAVRVPPPRHMSRGERLLMAALVLLLYGYFTFAH